MDERGVRGFLERETAGLPNWVWLVVLGLGIAVAYVLPRFVHTSNAPASSDTAQPGTVETGTQQSQSDMLSALSNYLNQLTQQGATTLAALQSMQAKLNPPATKRPMPPPKQPISGGGHLPPTVPGRLQPISTRPLPRSVIVQRWPQNGSTLGEIAKSNGTTVEHLVQLNPSITNPNRIYPGQVIRVR